MTDPTRRTCYVALVYVIRDHLLVISIKIPSPDTLDSVPCRRRLTPETVSEHASAYYIGARHKKKSQWMSGDAILTSPGLNIFFSFPVVLAIFGYFCPFSPI